jgi:hypothetical protein
MSIHADPSPDSFSNIDIDIDIDIDTTYSESIESKRSVEKDKNLIEVDVHRQGSAHVSGHVVGHLTVESATSHAATVPVSGDPTKAVARSVHAATSAYIDAAAASTYTVHKRPLTVRRQPLGAYQIGVAALGGVSVGTIVGAAFGGPVGAIVGAAAIAGVSAVSALNPKPRD